jgi:hypothetical protein
MLKGWKARYAVLSEGEDVVGGDTPDCLQMPALSEVRCELALICFAVTRTAPRPVKKTKNSMNVHISASEGGSGPGRQRHRSPGTIL